MCLCERERVYLEGLVGVVGLALQDKHRLLLVFLRPDWLDGEGGFAHEGVVKARVLAVPALVAEEGVEVLVVDVAAQPALEGVLAAVAADAVAVRHRPVAPGAEHALGHDRGGHLVQRLELDHEVGGHDRNRQFHGTLHLVWGEVERSGLLPQTPPAFELRDVSDRLVVVVEVDRLHDLQPPNVRYRHRDLLDRLRAHQLDDLRGVGELGLGLEGLELVLRERRLRLLR